MPQSQRERIFACVIGVTVGTILAILNIPIVEPIRNLDIVTCSL